VSEYRRDIDGLRAIAILSVLAYHVSDRLLPGGFIGVDVFFVISGFLITRIIASELDVGDFSISRFYVRRSRRILPALGAVLASTLIAGVLLLPPSDLAALGESTLSTAAFISNFQYWSEIGYFDITADRKLLLHTWSLAVEEQFYLLWPLILWAMHRLRFSRRLLIPAALALSFAISCWLAIESPPTAFFLLPPRAWELLCGAVLALRLVPAPATDRVRNVAGVIGLALIVAGCLLLNESTPFPGWNALYPCLGAALLIWAGEGGEHAVGRYLLATRPMVFVGLISYSLYLWHWPLLAYGRITQRGTLSMELGLALAAAAVVLATLTWRFVENPLRAGSARVPPAPVLLRYGALSLVLCLAGGTIYMSDGMRSYASAQMLKTERARRDINPKWTCLRFQADTSPLPLDRCLTGDPQAPRLVVWGDSHADSLAQAVSEVADDQGLATLQLTMAACPPLLGAEVLAGGDEESHCRWFNEQVLEYVRGDPRVVSVLLIGRWPLYTENTRFGADDGGPNMYLVDTQDPEESRESSRRVYSRSLARTIDSVRSLGKKVIVVGPIPPQGVNVPDCLARNLLPLSGQSTCSVSYDSVRRRAAFTDAEIERLAAARPGVCIEDPIQVLCSKTSCPSQRDGKILYANDDHLSLHGSRYLVEHWGLNRCLVNPSATALALPRAR
jgi:peptidoglycan/LPS O-acetylase OafA/YrhL